MKRTVTKEELEDLYITQNLSRDFICKKLNISHGKFSRLHKKFSLPKKTQEDINQSIKNTWQYNYGTTNVNSLPQVREKFRTTCQERFGGSTPMCSPEVQAKLKATCQERYGVDHPVYIPGVKEKIGEANKITAKDPEVQAKLKATCQERYGVDSYSKTTEYRNLISKNKDIYTAKKKATCIKHFGVDSYSKTTEYRTKYEQTCIQRFGVPYYTQTPEYLIRQYTTKTKNKSWNKSKPELDTKELLEKAFGLDDVIYQTGKTPQLRELYPWNCDFYIKSLNLFIECQYGWAHGDKRAHEPYNKLNPTHQEILSKWEKKKSTHRYYGRAIQTWTVTDPKKRKWVEEHHLNFKEFFSLKEFKQWLDSLERI